MLIRIWIQGFYLNADLDPDSGFWVLKTEINLKYRNLASNFLEFFLLQNNNTKVLIQNLELLKGTLT